MRLKFPVALVLTCTAITCGATENLQVLADNFVVLLRYEEQYLSYRAQCVRAHKTVTPEILVDKNPNYFGGIRPGQKKWISISNAYAAYFEEACARPTKAEFLGALSSSYAATLNAKQLKAAIDFYSSSSGKALVGAHSKATNAVYQTWSDINGKHLVEASAKFQAEISRLVASR